MGKTIVGVGEGFCCRKGDRVFATRKLALLSVNKQSTRK